MTAYKENVTAPVPSVGADGGQPLSNVSVESIADANAESNAFADNSEVNPQAQSVNDPAYLHTVSMKELYETVYRRRLPIIDSLLYPGLYLFAGAPKVGKSFLMAQIAYHVSTGLPLWEYPVRQGTVLYLALEDDFGRLQERLYRMFGVENTEKLRLGICAKQLGDGLDEQLQQFIQEHPDTKLVIIDTLQKVREVGGEKYSYGSDYEIVGRLKGFADSAGICLLLVHHTRKQQAEDRFDMISGTNGLLGAADGAFLLQKEKRTSNSATLDVSGRDQQDQRFHLTKDMERLVWLLEKAETELWREPPDPILEAVAALVMADSPEWIGSPTELITVLGLDMKPNVLTLRLNINAGRLLKEHHVQYENIRKHTGRCISLTLEATES